MFKSKKFVTALVIAALMSLIFAAIAIIGSAATTPGKVPITNNDFSTADVAFERSWQKSTGTSPSGISYGIKSWTRVHSVKANDGNVYVEHEHVDAIPTTDDLPADKIDMTNTFWDINVMAYGTASTCEDLRPVSFFIGSFCSLQDRYPSV